MRREMFVRLLACLAVSVGALHASVALADKPDRDEDHPYKHRDTKAWFANSGNLWHFQRDEKGRLLSFKRAGSRGEKVYFQYDDDSSKPTAAMLGKRGWVKLGNPKHDFQASVQNSCAEGLEFGQLPPSPTTTRMTMKNLVAASQRPLPQQFGMRQAGMPMKGHVTASLRPLPQQFEMRQVIDGQGDDPLDDSVLLQSYLDFQYIMEDMYTALLWEEFAGDPAKRERCINACNDITDIAWGGCMRRRD